MTIQWEQMRCQNPARMDKVLALYDRSFPLEVREPHDVFYSGFQYAQTAAPNQFCLLISVEGDQLLSFAAGHYLAEVNTGFVVYIAADPNHRNRGMGSKTLAKMEDVFNEAAILAGKSKVSGIILETEKEEEAVTTMEEMECRKRMQFFAKNQYQPCLGIDYVQPPLHPDGPTVPLNLLFKNLDGENVHDEHVREIVQQIYAEKYGAVNKIENTILRKCLKQMGI